MSFKYKSNKSHKSQDIMLDRNKPYSIVDVSIFIGKRQVLVNTASNLVDKKRAGK